jgi:hypothetical protein
MVYTVARDEPGNVVVTVLAPLTVDDQPVLCRAVKDVLRGQVSQLVFDLRRAGLGPQAATTAASVYQICGERQIACTVVADDLTALGRALGESTRTATVVPVASTVAQALVPQHDPSR